MRVLIAHNYYQSSTPSGENRTVDLVADALTEQGAEVELVSWRNDILTTASQTNCLRHAVRMVCAAGAGPLMERVVKFRPHVVQVHNPVPHVAPGDLNELRRQGVPVVHVVHNYRHSCLNGTHQFSNEDCHACTKSRWSRHEGVRRGCYRGSRLQSTVLALSETLYHDTWRNLDGYVAISEHVRGYLASSGFPAERIGTIPNPVPEGIGAGMAEQGRDVMFAGRLVPEKGIVMLVEAWTSLTDEERAGRVLHIAGAGPAETLIRAAAAGRSDIVLHGHLDQGQLAELGALCALSVVPSTWDEPFGRVAAEALAAGRGIVVSSRGGLAEFVKDPTCSWAFEPDAASLRNALRRATTHSPLDVSRAAKRLWKLHYSPAVVGRAYHEFLTSVVKRHRASSKAIRGGAARG